MFVTTFSHPTGDRLTRYTHSQLQFESEAEAIEAASKPFPAGTVRASVSEFFERSMRYIGERKTNGRFRRR
jgi:hypothetical protein